MASGVREQTLWHLYLWAYRVHRELGDVARYLATSHGLDPGVVCPEFGGCLLDELGHTIRPNSFDGFYILF